MDTITVTIDGKEVKAKRGATVLEAAREAEIYIPALCHHPDLTPFGACRLCIVEIEKMRGFPPACTTPAAEGMVVHTNTPKLQELRRSILELILSEHPYSCLTCPQNLNCELQRVACYIGLDEVTLPYTYKELPVHKEDPLIIRDYNLCILCGRCVRVCQEMRGVSAIAFTFRGSQATIGTAFERSLKDSGCKFCGACIEVCPTGALRDKDGRWGSKAEKEAALVPCKHACPAGVDVPRYIDFIAKGSFAEALAVIREKVPFPGVLGRVCIHPCEEACRRGQINEPIAIKALKRFAADHDNGLWRQNSKVAPPTGKRVAIVGAGPAGLTAAYYLAKLGHKVTIFESLPEPGGMMRAGIPEYRLPKEILGAEIAEIENIGVEIRTNSRVESLDKLLTDGYHAVFLAIGAHKGMKMGVEGEGGPGVIDCVSFLRDVNFGREVKLGDRVGIVGGGNAAVDASRVALRLGAKEVTIVYRRTQAEMPASPEEVDGAIEEGVKIHFLAAPSKITGENDLIRMGCIRMELGEPDASGRRRPVPIKGSEFTMEFNSVIAAIGQRPDIPSEFALRTGRGNTLEVNPDTLVTSREGVFAGGDAVSGAASVIEAIAAGRKAAESIDKYLGGDGVIDEVLVNSEELNPYLGRDDNFAYLPRAQMPDLSLEQRLNGFPEIELGLDREAAIAEAKRCLKCPLRLQISSPWLPPISVR
jgi:NADPH-dependent glutamate synthase beta subunit-like oxidoreductase/formate hydrogenlyase subunit 6/NADH:ubiquinone oxidoreductase subunit I